MTNLPFFRQPLWLNPQPLKLLRQEIPQILARTIDPGRSPEPVHDAREELRTVLDRGDGLESERQIDDLRRAYLLPDSPVLERIAVTTIRT